ncbi:MAG: hypothetical protein U0271_20435 [Polyangiaceae bacterium]
MALTGCGDSGESGGGGSGATGGSGGSPDVGGNGGDGGGTTPTAVDQFYTDFGASRFSQAEARAADLDALLDTDPTAADPAVVRALAHLWHVAEVGRDPNAGSVFAEQANLLSQFQQARDNAPDDPRVPCWLGLTMLGTGQATQDQTLIDQGFAMLDEGVNAYPEFNLFCVALAYGGYPASDPSFTNAIDALYQTMDLCFGETVDRLNPTIEPYLDQATSTGQKRVCWNDPIAPHNAEGFYLFFGDLLVKSGDLETALVMYGNAKLVAEYADWPYKSLLEGRLTDDLGARAALYADADLMNDPPIAGAELDRGCTYCHAATAAE